MPALLRLALLPLFACIASCTGTRILADPTLVIQTQSGTELGVSTAYGVVFLGRTAQSGRVEITAWLHDGPSVESAAVEPIGGGLYTAETEIQLPAVPLSFDEPKPGTELLLIGRNRRGTWERTVEVRADPRVQGLLLSIPRELENAPDQIGTGVFLVDPDDDLARTFVGLVSGRIRLSTAEGDREYLTVVGPRDTWRLVTHRRDLGRRKRWIYRDDIL